MFPTRNWRRTLEGTTARGGDAAAVGRKRCRRPSRTGRPVATLRRPCIYTQSHHAGQLFAASADRCNFRHRKSLAYHHQFPVPCYWMPVTRLLFEGMTADVKVSGVGRAEPGPLWSALAAADAGWHVFPCAPGSKRPALRENWQDLATTDHGRIRAWWARRPYNIGIACGQSGLVVIDLDVAPTARGDGSDGRGGDSTAPRPARTPSNVCAGRTVSATRRAPTPSTRRPGEATCTSPPRGRRSGTRPDGSGRSSTSAPTAATWSGTAA